MREEVLTVLEAAHRLKVMPKTVRSWLRDGKLPGVKIGRQWRVAASTLNALISGEITLGDERRIAGDRTQSINEKSGVVLSKDEIKLLSEGSDLRERATEGKKLRVAGLFAGIGGIERGLDQAGHETRVLCENEPGARAVLEARFDSRIRSYVDVRDMKSIPRGIDLVTAGFPCQDLSQAGLTVGIRGVRSGLVDEVFRLLSTAKHSIPWVLLENVPFMLQLNKGEALEHLCQAFESLGYDWAYRVVDSRSTGLPQRRLRVYFLASKVGDPRDVLLVDDNGEPPAPDPGRWRDTACGFYWTEGLRGLGWGYDAIPTLKAGSTIGIPSPPAIVKKSGVVVTPVITDAERLQGFTKNWTKPAEKVTRASHRWKLVGNAVTVPVAKWIGSRLSNPGHYVPNGDRELNRTGSWPQAVWCIGGQRYVADVSRWPLKRKPKGLEEFLLEEGRLLSERATAGFYSRIQKAKLRFPPGFVSLIADHLERVRSVAK